MRSRQAACVPATGGLHTDHTPTPTPRAGAAGVRDRPPRAPVRVNVRLR
jgi:hypothetical protein